MNAIAANDSSSDALRKTHHEANAEACQRKAEVSMHRDVESINPHQRLDLLAKSCPDTGSQYLKPMQLVENGKPLTGKPDVDPNLKRNPDGGTTEVTFDGGGTRKEITTNKYHELQKSVITRPDHTSTEFEVRGQNGFWTTERMADGSFRSSGQFDDHSYVSVHHDVDGKGGFTETTETFKDHDQTKKVHVEKATGEYSESIYKNGVLQSQGRFAHDGTPLPPEAVKPTAAAPQPGDLIEFGAKSFAQAADAVTTARDAGTIRNLGRIMLGGAAVIAALTESAPSVLVTIANVGKSLPARAIGSLAAPILYGIQGLGGIIKEANGDHTGRQDVGKAIFSWGVGGIVGFATSATGPFAPMLAGGASIGAGKLYDEIAEGKPITYTEAKEKHDSSWFRWLFEPREDNWAS